MSFAINNVSDEHLGFLLMTGGPEAGDCIFRSLPTKADLMNSAPSEILFQLQQQGEFAWHTEADEIIIAGPGGGRIAVIHDQRLNIGDLQLPVVELGRLTHPSSGTR